MVRCLTVKLSATQLTNTLKLTVNFSSILHALDAPDMKETETRLSGTIYSVILRGTDFPGINGVWLPLEIAEAEADKLDIPKDLKVVLFNGDLASLVSSNILCF